MVQTFPVVCGYSKRMLARSADPDPLSSHVSWFPIFTYLALPLASIVSRPRPLVITPAHDPGSSS
jgi:hypothetical protein